MRNIYLMIEFFFIILGVCGVLTQDEVNPDANISVTEVISGSKYTKHIAIWGVYTSGEMHLYGVGVLLKRDIVLSYTVINVTERQITARNPLEIHVGFTIVGTYRYPNRIPYSQADKWMDGRNYMKSTRLDLPQLGLIKINAILRLHPYYVALMELPQHDYNGSENCVIVGFGDFKDKVTFTHTLAFETKVKVLDVKTCREVNPDYALLHDNCICILSALGDEICEVAGGEPVICDGVLTGIVNSGACEKKKPRSCANVFRLKDWIEEQLKILSSNTSRPSLHKFTILYLVSTICRLQINKSLINRY